MARRRPKTPTGLIATAASSSQIDLRWVDAGRETSYRIQRSLTGSGSWSTVGTTRRDDVTFSNIGLDPSTRYFYRVTAVNNSGESPPSTVVSATTKAATTPDPVPEPGRYADSYGTGYAA